MVAVSFIFSNSCVEHQLAQRDIQLNAALGLLQSLQQDIATLKAGRTTETHIRTEDK
jgi:hypothetical protein